LTYQEFVTSRVKWLSLTEDLVHSAMGLLGECIEYREATLPSHILEELGDLEFYYEHAHQSVSRAGLLQTVPISRDEFRIIERDPEYWITHWCAEYHDLAKKAWVYNKALSSLNFSAPLVRIQLCLNVLANKVRMTRDQVQEHNQSKLETRYPKGYSDEAAQERADKVEA
jgi:hypothetical protein